MEEDKVVVDQTKKVKCKCNYSSNATGGCIYGLAFLGALVYYIQHARSFLEGFWGFLQALVWPAIVVYKLLELLLK